MSPAGTGVSGGFSGRGSTSSTSMMTGRGGGFGGQPGRVIASCHLGGKGGRGWAFCDFTWSWKSWGAWTKDLREGFAGPQSNKVYKWHLTVVPPVDELCQLFVVCSRLCSDQSDKILSWHAGTCSSLLLSPLSLAEGLPFPGKADYRKL